METVLDINLDTFEEEETAEPCIGINSDCEQEAVVELRFSKCTVCGVSFRFCYCIDCYAKFASCGGHAEHAVDGGDTQVVSKILLKRS